MKADGTVQFAPAVPVPSGNVIAGVVELGPPATPSNVGIVSETVVSGGASLSLTFNGESDHPNEKLMISEQVGPFSFFRGTVPYSVTPAGAFIMSATINTATQQFQNRTSPCFSLQTLIQGRVSASTPVI